MIKQETTGSIGALRRETNECFSSDLGFKWTSGDKKPRPHIVWLTGGQPVILQLRACLSVCGDRKFFGIPTNNFNYCAHKFLRNNKKKKDKNNL